MEFCCGEVRADLELKLDGKRVDKRAGHREMVLESRI